MRRIDIHTPLSSIATVRQLSNRENEIKEPTLILIKRPMTGSTSNSLGGFQFWEVGCYVPATSALALDILTEQVISVLKTLDIELTGNITPEFYDATLKAYTVSIEFRLPKLI